jgi:hypothetical protein
MIKKITILTSILFVVGMAIDGLYNQAHTNSSGALPGRVGAPADNGLTCAASGCHGATPQNASNLFAVGVPAAGYNPGQTYLVQVNFSGTGNKGFQISPQTVAGALQGELINVTTSGSSGTQTVGSGKYVTHTLPQSGPSGSWTFQWKAPAAGTGPVTFYGAFVNGRNTGLRLSQQVVQENLAASVADNGKLKNFRIYPNPVTDKVTVSYTLERNEKVNIKIFDITGRQSMQLLNSNEEAGEQQHVFEVKQSLAAGVYFIHVEAGSKRFSQKMLVK